MPSVFTLSLGCSKNRVDSERFLGILHEAGYRGTQDPRGADLCVVNTCGFLQSAVAENLDAILDLERMKERGEVGRIAVVGCLVNRYEAELRAELPTVDLLARAEDWEGFRRFLGVPRSSGCRMVLPGGDRFVRYLKVAEGCDNRCSYCMIPSIRGPLRSLPLRDLVREAEALVAEGAREICLVAQDLTAYGLDRGGRESLTDLLDALEPSLPRDVFLRLLYLHPERITTALLERVAKSPQIHSYLDVPVQHASPRILAAMGRPSDPETLARLFETARSIDPDFALRTTVMVGFPQETEADLSVLLRFLERVRFDRIGAFAFSPEEGAPAATLPHPVRPSTARRRLERVMDLGASLSFRRQRLFEGRLLSVLVERVEEGVLEGRSFREAPEVDGVVEIRGGDALLPGQRVSVRILEALEHDLIGRYEQEEEQA